MSVYDLGYRQHDFSGMQHANLDRVNPHVLDHRIDLLDQHVHWNRVNRPNALGVLGCEGSYGRHAKTSQGRESF